MAELHIEKKSSTAWIWWILGLVLLALLAWWLFGMGDDPEVAPVGAVPEAVAPAPVAAVGITDWAGLTGAGDAAVGQTVALTSVPVVNVVSDRGFWIGTGEADRMFVIRTNQAAAATPPDGAVNAGQSVSVFGTVQAMPSDLTQQATEWNLQSTDVSQLQQQRMYIAADSVRILQRP